LGLYSGSVTASGCSDSASNCTDFEFESSESFESELSFEEEEEELKKDKDPNKIRCCP
jgi:hypothetical protein